MQITQKAHRKLKKLVKQFRLILLMSIVYVVAGSFAYHKLEDWSWLDSIYFSVVSLTTVGYGDITPATSEGKIFTMFFLVFGIAIFGTFISNILKSRVAKKTLRSYEKHIVDSVEESIEKEFQHHQNSSEKKARWYRRKKN
jgi:voltage-gated potassium channel Kch